MVQKEWNGMSALQFIFNTTKTDKNYLLPTPKRQFRFCCMTHSPYQKNYPISNENCKADSEVFLARYINKINQIIHLFNKLNQIPSSKRVIHVPASDLYKLPSISQQHIIIPKISLPSKNELQHFRLHLRYCMPMHSLSFKDHEEPTCSKLALQSPREILNEPLYSPGKIDFH